MGPTNAQPARIPASPPSHRAVPSRCSCRLNRLTTTARAALALPICGRCFSGQLDRRLSSYGSSCSICWKPLIASASFLFSALTFCCSIESCVACCVIAWLWPCPSTPLAMIILLVRICPVRLASHAGQMSARYPCCRREKVSNVTKACGHREKGIGRATPTGRGQSADATRSAKCATGTR
jgi:hypothetical protein